ncbi:S-norcoclaurine synthase 1 [Carex littledalei]|uniref:S-norcoclaurine synthase 1 n=1 Tax=Carex littledalei TaxID=544730 RepID=A0A833QQ07_9POAL|nr:S-norcoclaurine synthase 1 [Carex littledalei]
MASTLEEELGSVEFVQVESVQALASNFGASSTNEVPDRYIRSEVEADMVVEKGSFELQVIDLAKLRDPQFSQTEIAKLGCACGEWGFFQLINHGVDKEVLERVKADITAFFNLPVEQKEAVAIANKGVDGFGHHFIVSNEQKLDWADMLYLTTRPVNERNLRFWPTNPPTFRDTFNKYSLELNKVAGELLEAMSKDLEIESDVLFNLFKGQPQSMRMNYYPPCPQPEKVLGLSAHTDGSGITLLLHVNDVQGLQIRKDKMWFSVETLPGALVVNIGDVLEIASNGRYRSIEHRAVVNTTKERISIANFQSPCHLANMGPLPEVVKGGKENYKSLPYIEYFKGYFSDKLEGRNYMESLKIN